MNAVMKVNDNLPLETWVVQAQKGDRSAFETLVQRTQMLVYKTANPLVPPHMADDAVQETYLVVFQKLRYLRCPEAFRAWLLRITVHVCSELRAKAQRGKDGEMPLEVGCDPTAELSGRLDLRAALQEMNPDDRHILVMRDFLGLSYEEVAFALRIPLGTVRSRLHYGRKKLKALLQG